MKKLFVWLMTATLLLSVFAPCLAVEQRLSREEIPLLREDSAEAAGLKRLGILKGTENGLELGRNVTRAEAVVLIQRTAGIDLEKISFDFDAPPFRDISGHWAEEMILAFYGMGYIDGTSETTFEPDRNVTGQEFVKILLTVMGYDGVTLENAYEKGKETEVLSNNFTISVVYNNENLLRGDAARLCFHALTAKTPEGELLYKTLIDKGLYERNDFEGVLFVGCGTPPAYPANFVDKLNAQMPEDKNYMFSPLSVKMAFAMAANGAEGETQNQLLDALEIENLDSYNDEAKALMERYNQSDVLKLNVANSIWINQDRMAETFTKSFQDTVKEYYNAETNMVTNGNAVETINGWVDKQTNGKIKEIISSNQIEAVLLNAIYFKGTWDKEFNERATQKDLFTDRNGQQTEIDFMNRTGYMPYYRADGLEVVELPYKNVQNTFDENGNPNGIEQFDFDVSMYLIKGVYRDEQLSSLIENETLSSTYVALSMPKFKIEFDTKLNGIMQNLGATDAFVYGRADFDPMIENGNGEYYIKDSIHKTYIEVDEKGTEAAAVTAIMVGATGVPVNPEPTVVKFDEPFTFVIRDNTSGEVLFIGEYAFAQ